MPEYAGEFARAAAEVLTPTAATSAELARLLVHLDADRSVQCPRILEHDDVVRLYAGGQAKVNLAIRLVESARDVDSLRLLAVDRRVRVRTAVLELREDLTALELVELAIGDVPHDAYDKQLSRLLVADQITPGQFARLAELDPFAWLSFVEISRSRARLPRREQMFDALGRYLTAGPLDDPIRQTIADQALLLADLPAPIVRHLHEHGENYFETLSHPNAPLDLLADVRADDSWDFSFVQLVTLLVAQATPGEPVPVEALAAYLDAALEDNPAVSAQQAAHGFLDQLPVGDGSSGGLFALEGLD